MLYVSKHLYIAHKNKILPTMHRKGNWNFSIDVYDTTIMLNLPRGFLKFPTSVLKDIKLITRRSIYQLS